MRDTSPDVFNHHAITTHAHAHTHVHAHRQPHRHTQRKRETKTERFRDSSIGSRQLSESF